MPAIERQWIVIRSRKRADVCIETGDARRVRRENILDRPATVELPLGCFVPDLPPSDLLALADRIQAARLNRANDFELVQIVVNVTALATARARARARVSQEGPGGVQSAKHQPAGSG
jgi:hypothetical protein